MAQYRPGPVLGLLLAGLFPLGCASPTTTPPAPGAVSSLAPSPSQQPVVEMVTGEFFIRNTTPGGAPARIETVQVALESASAEGASWTAVDATCDTQPRAPVSFDDTMTLGYSCAVSGGGLSDAARLRAIVEATIAGTNETFRLESELER